MIRLRRKAVDVLLFPTVLSEFEDRFTHTVRWQDFCPARITYES